MASMQLALAPFTLCSSWITREDGSFTTPSMAQEMKRFGASALPAGSTVQSATLIVTAAMRVAAETVESTAVGIQAQ